MKKQKPAFSALLYGITLLFLAGCGNPLQKPGTPADLSPGAVSGGKTGRVVVSITTGTGEAAAPETASARTLLPDYGVLSYTLSITKKGESAPVFTEEVMETRISAELEPGTYTVSVSAKNSGGNPAAEGSAEVSVSPGQQSAVTVVLAGLDTGSGDFEYTVTLPSIPPVSGGTIELFSLPGGTVPAETIDLTGGLGGVKNVPAGYYRAVLRVTLLGKRVAKTLVVHIASNTPTRAAFNLEVGDFIPTPPEGGSVLYIATQGDLAAINLHIASAAMNNGKNAYVLLNDIALSGSWEPIGNYISTDPYDRSGVFQGYFFGEGRRITGFVFSAGDSVKRGRGLFGYVYKAVIRDLRLETDPISITMPANSNSSHAVGLLAGVIEGSSLANIDIEAAPIEVNCPSSFSGTLNMGGAAGEIKWTGSTSAGGQLTGITLGGDGGAFLSLSSSASGGVYRLGGIGGYAQAATVRNCAYFGTLTASAESTVEAGGIIAGGSGRIEECGVMADIRLNGGNDQSFAGGITGERSTIVNCYVLSRIRVESDNPGIRAGGIAGHFNLPTISKSYAAGSLEYRCGTPITYPVGGLIGGYKPAPSQGTGDGPLIQASASLMERVSAWNGTDYYANRAGRISLILKSDESVKEGFPHMGENIAYNYSLVNGVVISDAAADPQNELTGLGKSAAELRDRTTYESGLGWDFDTVWEMGPSDYPYPILRWQQGALSPPSWFTPLSGALPAFDEGLDITLEEDELSLSVSASTIYKNKNPRETSVTAPGGYDAYQWFVDGMRAGNAQSLSLHASMFALGSHRISAVVYRGTVPYSKSILITVMGE